MRKLTMLACVALLLVVALLPSLAQAHGQMQNVTAGIFPNDGVTEIRMTGAATDSEVHPKIRLTMTLEKYNFDTERWTLVDDKTKVCENTDYCYAHGAWIPYNCHMMYQALVGAEAWGTQAGWHDYKADAATKLPTC